MTAEERLYVKCAALKNAAIDEAVRIMVKHGDAADLGKLGRVQNHGPFMPAAIVHHVLQASTSPRNRNQQAE